MNTVSVRLPDSLHRKVVEVSREDGISIDQFISTAVAEKLSALMTVDYLRQRAERSSKEAFEKALSEIPDVEPDAQDRL